MRRWAILLTSLWLAACAQSPVATRPAETLFQDQRFAAPRERFSADEVFALSDEMKQYLRQEIVPQVRSKGVQRGLMEALYQPGQLKLDYDTGTTRNAAQAFAGRSGNCLSLVIMTAAFAKELQLEVEFQSAFLEETWSRSGNLYLRSGHVNVTLGKRFIDTHAMNNRNAFTVDFLPPSEIRGLRTQTISERTVVSMYLNNRAAETLLDGRIDDAYWFARESVQHSPLFMSAYNTLGVIYLRHGDTAQAERVFAHVLEREPENTRAMFNLALALDRQGRGDEAQSWRRRLAQIEPNPPFHFFNLGIAAMQRGDFPVARGWFEKEVARAAYNHEFHFWLGLAHYRLGDVRSAQQHLGLAIENSPTRGERDLYAAKLSWLRGHSPTRQ